MEESQPQQGKMATSSFQCKPPEEFTFTNPSEWPQWKRRFERFRIVSGLASKCSVEQVYALVYFMGDKAEDILASLKLTDEQKNNRTSRKLIYPTRLQDTEWTRSQACPALLKGKAVKGRCAVCLLLQRSENPSRRRGAAGKRAPPTRRRSYGHASRGRGTEK
ncbi:hypothetical protein HPB50_007223 [Hyalomma asiaticum]|uniref:Uncharacterized protein n=1 Tax=Hyalomma asiaticum TaxID=266040 RepID=A0ACB7S7T2_HYAAI|nr:hypothetical protein HPB50_007223 [Hyalomma asiaticum]